MVWLADLDTKRTRPPAVCPVTSRTSASIAELDAGEPAFGDLDDGQHRIERDDLRDFLAR